MANLLSTIQGALSSDVIGKISQLVGSNVSQVQSGLSRLFPTILSGIVSKGSTESGASSLINLIKNNGLGGSTLNNLSSQLNSGSSANSFLEKGGKINSALFGSATDDMKTKSGLSGASSSKLINIATPLVMSSLGRVIEKDNLDANGLAKFLDSQKGMAQMAAPLQTQEPVSTSSGAGFLKFLIPLFILAAIVWWFLNRDNGELVTAEDNIEQNVLQTRETATHSHTHSDGTVHTGAAHGDATDNNSTTTATNNTIQNAVAYTIDADGNLLNSDGEIIMESGTYTTKDGKYYDMEGKELNLIQKVGKALGSGATAVGGAVGDAAEATADAFKDIFGSMFKKKKEGAPVANYTLGNITFNRENHKIENFSKNEVIGLANALKMNADSKIKVQVYTNDGADDDNNKKLSKTRAEVVRDMLVTLGVDKKQISYDGMGTGDVSKAIRDKVEIVVEQ